MNNFFKMSLVAAAVAVSGTATAGQMTAITNSVFSSEGIVVTTAAEQLVGGFSYTVGTDYEAGAAITFTYSAGALGAGTVFPSSLTTDVVKSGGTMTLTKSAQTADSVTYTVTAKQGSGSVIGNVIKIPSKVAAATTPAVVAAVDGVTINTSAIKAGPVTVKASAVYQGVAFDPDTTTTAPISPATEINTKANYLASTATQFGKFSVAPVMAGQIAIDTTLGALGKVLTSADKDATFVIEYDDTATTATKALIGQTDGVNVLDGIKLTTKYSVKGQFPGFKTTQFTAKDDATTPLDLAGVVSLTSTGFDMAIPAAASVVPYATVKTQTLATNDALVVQNFTVTPMVTYTGGSKSFEALSAGAWTVSAETAGVTYMPYGDGVSQIIYLTNTGTKDVKVAVTATDENGVKYALGTLVTAKANGQITKITEEVRAALLAQGFSKGKVALDFIFVNAAALTGTDAPTVKVYSAYNVNGTDRGYVANTTNGAK